MCLKMVSINQAVPLSCFIIEVRHICSQDRSLVLSLARQSRYSTIKFCQHASRKKPAADILAFTVTTRIHCQLRL